MLLDPNPPRLPADWAVAWGEDAYGLWQAFEIGGVRQVMRWVPPGRFQMGSPSDEPERHEDETEHEVTLTRGFWLAETACTQAPWRAVTGENPSRFTEDSENPVEQVSWDDCAAFVERANERPHGGLVLRFPTEAEWEYACRAGTRTPFGYGDELKTNQANYYRGYAHHRGGNRRLGGTVSVRSFEPNHQGLYQMHGNVEEWCADWYGDYPRGPVLDPVQNS
jgi:formylglycine-generating enzyme